MQAHRLAQPTDLVQVEASMDDMQKGCSIQIMLQPFARIFICFRSVYQAIFPA